jgi:hypothetical protein
LAHADNPITTSSVSTKSDNHLREFIRNFIRKLLNYFSEDLGLSLALTCSECQLNRGGVTVISNNLSPRWRMSPEPSAVAGRYVRSVSIVTAPFDR